MKIVKVVAAIIIKDKMVFSTQRGYGFFKDGWEFPGGKIETGETPEEALRREIKEELNTDINVGHFFQNVEYDYETFHLSMQCYICNILNGNLDLLEAENSKWLSLKDIRSIDWLPADLLIIDNLVAYLSKI